MRFSSHAEAQAAYRSHVARLEEYGIYNDDATAYLTDEDRKNFNLAMDAAQPGLTTAPNSGIPAWMSNWVDPKTYEIFFAPNTATSILNEERKGDWVTDTAWFPVVESTGEVSSYGDFSENGSSGANTNWPQRQSYLFQIPVELGDREIARAGLARLNWVALKDAAAAKIMAKYLNLTYFFGVSGLENYGIINDPNLPATIQPTQKAYGGVAWIVNGHLVATPNEVYNDVVALYTEVVSAGAGQIDDESPMVLALGPVSATAFKAANSFNVNVTDLLKKNFPKMRVETAVQYNQKSAANPQGVTGGNFMQLIVEEVEGQETGTCGYNEKMRAHPIVRGLSSYKKKLTGGTWGAIYRQTFTVGSMIGI